MTTTTTTTFPWYTQWGLYGMDQPKREEEGEEEKWRGQFNESFWSTIYIAGSYIYMEVSLFAEIPVAVI